MRAPTEILGVRYFLLGVIFARTDTRVESSHQGTPQNKNKSSSFHLQTAKPLGQVCVYYFRGCQHLWARPLHPHHILFRGYRLLVPSRPGLITYHIWVQYPLYPIYTIAQMYTPDPDQTPHPPMSIHCSHHSS